MGDTIVFVSIYRYSHSIDWLLIDYKKKALKELNDYIAHAQNETHVFKLVVVTGLSMALFCLAVAGSISGCMLAMLGWISHIIEKKRLQDKILKCWYDAFLKRTKLVFFLSLCSLTLAKNTYESKHLSNWY